MGDKAALLREVEIALDAVRAGIETIAMRPDAAAMQADLAILQYLIDRSIDALEALARAGLGRT